jgi:hypothetical protein
MPEMNRSPDGVGKKYGGHRPPLQLNYLGSAKKKSMTSVGKSAARKR